MDVLKDEEVAVLRYLNRFSTNRAHELVSLYTGQLLMDVTRRIETKPLERIEDIKDMFTSIGFSEDGEVADMLAAELLEFAYAKCLEAQEVRVDERLTRWRRRGANRERYVPEPVYRFYQYDQNDQSAWRWVFERDLRNFGLLSLIVKHINGPQSEPVAIAVLHQKPPRASRFGINGASREVRGEDIFDNSLDVFEEEGIAVSGGRLGWNMKSPAWNILTKALPKAIDASAYGHGLNAPVIQAGFITDAPVTFKVLRDLDGNDLQTDGSGIYHPECPHMQEFIAKHGLVACQPRILHPTTGLYAKGTLFPSELALDEKGNPAIVCDWRQIKGRFKAVAKERREASTSWGPEGEADDIIKTVDGCYIGMLQAWSKPSKLGACFELGENIQINERTIEITKELVEQAMALLDKKGIDGLVAEVAKKDPVIHMMVQLVELGRQQGMSISAYQVPRIRDAVLDKLGRRLFNVGQGIGLRLPSYVCRLDNTVPPGHCVASGLRANKQVVGFRFPLVLAQGLVSLRTMDPLPHHLVNGKVAPYSVILNPADLTIGMQGDDDGDFMGISDSEMLVELFSHRLDEHKFHIEPKGKEILGRDGKPLMTDTAEGRLFIRKDHRGDVGRMTIYRSRLLAVGDHMGALACSIAIQECIDAGKRAPEWSDIRLAAKLSNWVKLEDGYHFHHRFKPKDLGPGGAFPIDLIRKWVNGRLIAKGCCYMTTDPITGEEELQAKDPLWWRAEGKKFDLELGFDFPEEDARHENLVHVGVRHMATLWEEMADRFGESKQQVPMSMLLPTILALRGIKASWKTISWGEYLTLRVHLGLTRYNQQLKALMAKKEFESEEQFRRRMRQTTAAQTELEEHLTHGWANGSITLQDIITCWVMEWSGITTPEGTPSPNPNNAFRAVCWQGSEVLKLLGLESPKGCQFLLRGKTNRKDWVIEKCLAGAEPFEKLQQIVKDDKRHAEECKDQADNPVPLHDCPECMAELQTYLVRVLRTRKAYSETQWLLELHSALRTGQKEFEAQQR